jgi:hypothetical protein
VSFNSPTSSLPLTVRQDFQPRSADGIYTGARSLLSAFFSILPTHFFLTPKIRKTTNTHNNPQQNITYVDNTTTSQQSCMYAFHFSTSFFCLFIVVVVASSIEVVVARSQIKSISTAVIKTTTQCTCIATPRAVALIIAKAIEIQFSDQKSR